MLGKNDFFLYTPWLPKNTLTHIPLYIDGWMDGLVDGYMDGWMDGWMGGWMDRMDVLYFH